MPAPELAAYLPRLCVRLGAILDGELLGVYAGGSLALGAYEHGRSDVDVVAVSRGALSVERKQLLVEQLRHEAFPCPARGLELVVYAEQAIGEPSPEPGFEVELNSGAAMEFHAALDPSGANGRHWYVLDRALLARHGVTLLGPPPSALFAHVPRELVLPALDASLRWFAEYEASSSSAVLNACRALRYASEGRWASKADAGRWALERLGDRELISEALLARETGDSLDGARVKRFLDRVGADLRNALPGAAPGRLSPPPPA
jgi:hypothetical protein